MAGHSKWANIKHRKAAQDKRREKKFTKILKDIQIAAKNGSPDPNANPILRLAIQNAKGVNIPKDTIDRAIAKARKSNEANLQYVVYEAQSTSNVGLIIEATTDNLNRTVSNVRAILNKANGSLLSNGTLSFIFEQQGFFEIPDAQIMQNAEEFELSMIDGGALECNKAEDTWEIYTAFSDFGTMQKHLEKLNIQPRNSELIRVPKLYKNIQLEEASKVLKLIEKLEDDEDINTVWHNMELTEDIVKMLSE